MDPIEKKGSPLLSICVPAYNAATLLKRCLDSIILQQFRDYEVIITDDSTDGKTIALVNQYQERLPIRYEHHEKGLGSPGNWNRALELAVGKWVMVLHQDDWLASPRTLEIFMTTLQKLQGVDFAFGKIEPDEDPEVLKKIPRRIKRLKDRPEIILMQNVIGAPSNVVFRNRGDIFDPSLFWVVDLEMYFRWLKRGDRYVYIAEKLVEIGKHDEQVTAYCDRNPDIKLRENAYLINKHGAQVKMDIRLYDFLWRQVRNTSRIVPDKMEQLAHSFPPLMQRQWDTQQGLNRSLLSKGWYSKIMMIFSWFKERSLL